jgi:hypothetical protein
MCFDRFLELIFPREGDALFAPTVYFVPGNHDHHLWEISREAQFVDYIARHRGKEFLRKPWHVTNMFGSEKRVSGGVKMLDLWRFESASVFRAASPWLGQPPVALCQSATASFMR